MQREHVRYLLEQLGPETTIASLTPQRIARALEAEAAGRRPGRPLSGGTLRKRASTLSQAIELARGGRAPRLPEIPYRYRPRRSYLQTFESYAQLRDILPPDRRLWFVLATFTGQRRSDVERMSREDFDPDLRFVVVRSTKTRRPDGIKIHAADELVRELRAHWEQLGPGAKLVPAWPDASSALRRYCDRASLPRLSPQSLRHTFFTWFVAANGFNAELLEIGGWSDLRIPSLVYAHAHPVRFRGQIERAVAAATSKRLGPHKSPGNRNSTAQRREAATSRGDDLGAGLRSPRPGETRSAGTNSRGNSAERIGPAGVAAPAGPETRPVGDWDARSRLGT